MADYNEQSISGTSWQRAWQIVISNPLDGVPTVRYDEERVIDLGDTQIRQSVGGNLQYEVDLSDTIALRDPITREPTGQTIPAATVHLAIISDYVNRALARDQNNA